MLSTLVLSNENQTHRGREAPASLGGGGCHKGNDWLSWDGCDNVKFKITPNKYKYSTFDVYVDGRPLPTSQGLYSGLAVLNVYDYRYMVDVLKLNRYNQKHWIQVTSSGAPNRLSNSLKIYLR